MRNKRLTLPRVLPSLLIALIAIMVVGCSQDPAQAEPTLQDQLSGPRAADRQITRHVAALVSQEHLTSHELDDEISGRCLDEFLKALDPWKIYFYQSDVDTFNKYRTKIDEMIQSGDISLAYLIFNTFLKRIDERVEMVDTLLDGEFDFTRDEVIISDRDLARYPKTKAEALDRWRKRIKYDLLMLKDDDTEGDEAIEKLRRRYHSFDKRMHQTDQDELLEMYLTSLTTSFDPHTTYMSPSTLKNFEIMMKLELDGIGASLQSDDGYTVVKDVIKGGAADKDGRLKIEDRIVGVGQGPDGEIVDVVDMKLNDVVKQIRGKRGTIVRLEVQTPGEKNQIIDITRDRIELKDSEAKGEILEAGLKPDGKPYRIGVIDLPSFYMDMDAARNGLSNFRSTTRDVLAIIENFKKEGIDAIVLDLRRNGGGSLTEAINLTGLFIPEGPVVQVKGPDGSIRPFNDLNPTCAWSGPLVVLNSKFSASASEILAGAIQDYHRGLIVGDQTSHGKGTVQSLLDLSSQLFRLPNMPSMGALKLTMQQFYRPSGDSTQKRGVESDVELPSLTTHLDVGEQDLDFPVEFDRVPKLKYQNFNQVNDDIVNKLKELSQPRIEKSEDFQRVSRNIERYLEQKSKKYVTLNEEKFMKEREELNADKEEREQLEEIANGNKEEGIERDYYMDEALAITVDYIQLLGNKAYINLNTPFSSMSNN